MSRFGAAAAAAAADDQSRQAVTWAAGTITQHGGVLHAVPGGWDVEWPDGRWSPCNTTAELCGVAREFQNREGVLR